MQCAYSDLLHYIKNVEFSETV